MLLVIDNYDSFTFNLVQYLGEENVDMEVHRNDEITLDQVEALAILVVLDRVVLDRVALMDLYQMPYLLVVLIQEIY